MKESDLLRKVLAEIQRLQSETERLKNDAATAASAFWMNSPQELVHIFEEFFRSIDATSLSTFSIQKNMAHPIPTLSISSLHPNPFAIDAAVTFSTPPLPEIIRQVRLAIASLDLHADFREKCMYIPLSINDSPCGIVICQTPLLSKENYPNICSKSAKFLKAFQIAATQRPSLEWNEEKAS